jgi:hypothetical protein
VCSSAASLSSSAAVSRARRRYSAVPGGNDEGGTGSGEHDDTAQAKLDKLDAVLAQTSTSKQDAALFAEMLSLPNDGRYPAAVVASAPMNWTGFYIGGHLGGGWSDAQWSDPFGSTTRFVTR